MSQMEKGTFASSTGQELDKRVWMPEGAPKAIVQMVHGMWRSISTATTRLRGRCAMRGIRSWDVRQRLGHGPKATIQGHFADEDGWNRLLEDIHRLRTETEKGIPRRAVFHSGA